MQNSTQAPAHEPNEVSRHINALDGVRGVAISFALTTHLLLANDKTGSRIGDILVRVGTAGWIGVDLFFVLSGFLITGILFDSLDDTHYFRNFYARRALRIFPLYYAVIFLSFLAAAHSGPISFRPVLYVCLFLQNTPLWLHLPDNIPGTGLLAHLWSLAVEEQFYIFWPLIVFLVRKRRTLLWVAAGLALCAPLIRSVLYARHSPWQDIYIFTTCRADTLLAGAILALLVRGPARQTVLRLAPFVFWPTLALCVLVVVRTHYFGTNSSEIMHWGYSTLALTFTSFLAMALVPGSLVSRLMSLGWLRFLGKYSYGIYVLHFGIIAALRAFVFPHIRPYFHSLFLYHAVVPLLALAVAIPVAMASFHFYEKPFLRLKRYFNYDRGVRQMV